MEITKSGLYKISECLAWSDSHILIAADVKVAIYDDRGGMLKIEVSEKAHLDYFSFFSAEQWYDIHFWKEIHLIWDSATANVNSLNYWEENKINVRVVWESKAHEGKLDIKILSFAGQNANIKIDWVLTVDAETTGNVWELDEENIFLWESGKISGIPTLFVETNDMEAGHACRMERISDEKLFYLRSRGVWRENALRIMLEAKVKDLLKDLEAADQAFYNNLLEEILEKIQ